MKWLLVRSTALLLLLAVTALAQGVDRPSVEAYSFDFTGGGARAEGMGKAFIGVSDDITAGSWNPAGLYVQEKPALSLSYGSLAPRGSTSADLFQSISEFDHTGSFDNLTSANFLAPIRLKGHHFVGSFNYTRNFDEFQGLGFSFLRHDFMYTHLLTGDSIFSWSDIGVISELHGGLNSVNMGFGTRMYRNLSFGVSLNVYAGEAVRDQLSTVLRDSVEHYLDVGSYYKQLIEESVIDTNKFSGFNFTIGFKFNGEKLDAGLIIRTPFSLKVKTGRSIFIIVKQGSPLQGELLNVVTDTTYYDDLLAEYKLPLMVGGGVAYRASENLLLALDAEYRHFSDCKVDLRDSLRIDPGGNNEEYFTEFDPGWKNVFAVRAGGEYLYQTKIGVIPIRAGLGYVPMPNQSINISGDTSAVVMYNISLGSGIHWSQIHLDMAYTYSRWDLELSDPVSSVEFKNRDHHLNFSFTGYF